MLAPGWLAFVGIPQPFLDHATHSAAAAFEWDIDRHGSERSRDPRAQGSAVDFPVPARHNRDMLPKSHFYDELKPGDAYFEHWRRFRAWDHRRPLGFGIALLVVIVMSLFGGETGFLVGVLLGLLRTPPRTHAGP